MDLHDTTEDHVSINLLPPEVLSAIFLCLAEDLQDPSDLLYTRQRLAKDRRRRLRHVLLISSICQHWRAVALSCPPLWSELEVTRRASDLTDLMFERSRDAPLSISFSDLWPSPRQVSFLREALLQTHRLRSVVITTERNTKDGLDFLPLFSTWEDGATLPCLEILSLRDLSSRACHVSLLPERFLRGGAASLKELCLHGFDLFPPNSKFSFESWGPQLTHLTLETFPDHEDDSPGHWFLPSCPEIFLACMAQQAPSLKRLSLVNSLPRFSKHTSIKRSHARDPIPFQQLRSIFVHDYPKEISYFLRCIRIPHASQLTMSYRRQADGVLESLDEVLEHLPTSWRGGPNNAAEIPGFSSIALTAPGHSQPPEISLVPASSPSAHAGLIISTIPFNPRTLLPSVPRHLDLRPLTSLLLEGAWVEPIRREEWGSMFGWLPHLARIVLQFAGAAVVELVAALRVNDEDGHIDLPGGVSVDRGRSTVENTTPPFPALTTLVCYSVDFGDKSNPREDGIALLTKAWEGGYRASCPPIKLVAAMCSNFTGADADLLRARVPGIQIESEVP